MTDYIVNELRAAESRFGPFRIAIVRIRVQAEAKCGISCCATT